MDALINHVFCHCYSIKQFIVLCMGEIKGKSVLYFHIVHFKGVFAQVPHTWANTAHCRSLVSCIPFPQPAVRPGCTRCRALKITQNNRLLCRIYETVVPKTIFLLRHGDSFVLPYITFFSIDKQLASPQHSIHGANREVNAPAVL